MIVQRFTINRTPAPATPVGGIYRTVPEVATILRKSPSWIYKQISAGNLAHHRQGRSIFFTDDDIRDNVAAAKRPAKKQATQQTRQKKQTSKPAPAPAAAPAVEQVAPVRHLHAVDDIPVADPNASRKYRANTA